MTAVSDVRALAARPQAAYNAVMWSLAVTGIVVVLVLARKRRSGLPWVEFILLGVSRISVRLMHHWYTKGQAPIPAAGPALLYCNHTCSADPVFLVATLTRVPSFLVAQEHYGVHPRIFQLLEYLGAVPVRRDGCDPASLRKALSRLRNGRLVALFPEGNLSGVERGRLRSPKLGLAFLALVSRAPVYPIYIHGGPRTHHLLPSWILPSFRPLKLCFGPPVDLSMYFERPRTRASIEEVARYLMRQLEELRPKEPRPK